MEKRTAEIATAAPFVDLAEMGTMYEQGAAEISTTAAVFNKENYT